MFTSWSAFALRALRDVPDLLRVRVCSRAVGENVRSDGCVDRGRDVRVDQRHRCPLGQLLAGDRVQLLTRELSVLLVLFAHVVSSSDLRGLRDVAGLLRVRIGDGVVAQHVECCGEVDRRGDVRVDQRHRCPLGQLLACDCVQLLACELLVLLVFAHCNASFRCYVDWSMGVCWIASAYAVALSERTLAASATFTGIARFAFTSDIAARSGSSSPASWLSSSRVSVRYSSCFLPMPSRSFRSSVEFRRAESSFRSARRVCRPRPPCGLVHQPGRRRCCGSRGGTSSPARRRWPRSRHSRRPRGRRRWRYAESVVGSSCGSAYLWFSPNKGCRNPWRHLGYPGGYSRPGKIVYSL